MKTKSIVRISSLFVSILFMLLAGCQKEAEDGLLSDGYPSEYILKAPGNQGAGNYIVVLQDNFTETPDLDVLIDYDRRNEVLHGYLNRFLNEKGIGNDQLDLVYSEVFRGFAARLSAKQVERLRNDPWVKAVYPDEIYALKKPPTTPTDPPAQTIPWGIFRVGGAGDGLGKTAWVVDSGIDLDHPDLNVDVTRSRSYVTTERKSTPDDSFGHGTHVAGTIAALNNNIGVVGVAAGASVVSCRVLDRRGSGSFSWTVAALDYIAGTGNSGDVINMSLGPSSRYIDSAVDAAVQTVASKGILLSIAAGNESDDCTYYSPAHNNGNGIYTISAMDSNDRWASFSNYGSPVDYCAPGVSILSTYKGGGYATMSGTSMAAPHVAGLLLLGAVHTDGTVINDPSSPADPIAHR